jgi:hypothetical protein
MFTDAQFASRTSHFVAHSTLFAREVDSINVVAENNLFLCFR